MRYDDFFNQNERAPRNVYVQVRPSKQSVAAKIMRHVKSMQEDRVGFEGRSPYWGPRRNIDMGEDGISLKLKDCALLSRQKEGEITNHLVELRRKGNQIQQLKLQAEGRLGDIYRRIHDRAEDQ
mmetsp:Transcript_10554/g.27646  ORF Transcript_10554/g.27646 Transcript_10554/m.27646 type:complete len:124 (+) Transcript_10554:2754-3125(+)